MKVTRRELLKGAAALGVAGALPQALPGAAQAQTTQKKELVSAQAGDIAKFDPHFSTASQDIRVSFNLFDNLTSRHPDGKLYPGLASRSSGRGAASCPASPSPRATLSSTRRCRRLDTTRRRRASG
jgi:ABC-type transport system substrate-binding protein